jgi:hypothetical protein
MAPQKKANGNGGRGKAKPPEQSTQALEVLNRSDAADCLPKRIMNGTAYLATVDGELKWIPEADLLTALAARMAGRPPT